MSCSPIKSRPPSSAGTSRSARSERVIHSSPASGEAVPGIWPLRVAKLLPFELQEHCLIYFEENLYIQALNLLSTLLTSGVATSNPQPALVAPPSFLALIATLTVHPTLTTRAKSQDHRQASNLALRYLRLVVKHVGPIHGQLAEAFTFATPEGSRARRRGMGRRRTADHDDGSPVKGAAGAMDNDLANAGAVWANAEDFWHVVGWAFNCSVVHKRRWEVWRAWLAYMLAVFEEDWDLRGPGRRDGYESSFILRYIDGDGSMRRNEKRILRAIFADGTSKAMGEFGEVWRNETKELKKEGDGVQKVEMKKKIDIEADEYGDYMDEENEADFEDSASSTSSSLPNGSRRTSKSQKKKNAPLPFGADSLGGLDAFNLRLCLLSLLSTVSFNLPGAFIPLRSLYDLYLDHIRPLPLPTFFLFMSDVASARHFTAGIASSLTQYILLTILESSAPQPTNDDLNQDSLERCYLPFAANTTNLVDNTKVSLCVEALLRLCNNHDGGLLVRTPELQDAAEKGIQARQDKVRKVKQKKGLVKDGGANDESWLIDSAEHIRMVVAMAPHPADDGHDVEAPSSDG